MVQHIGRVRGSGALTTAMVVIGRNAGKGLRTSLPSALRQCTRVVYVDSGSTDGSPSLARQLGAGMVQLYSSSRFTPAKARNAGFAYSHVQPEALESVQFLNEDREPADAGLYAAAWVIAGFPYSLGQMRSPWRHLAGRRILIECKPT